MILVAAKCIVAVLAFLSALGVAFSPQAVHSALCLTFNLLCVAVLYLLMSLHFLGAAQLLVYAGAIMVVFLFAVTVLAPEDEMLGKWNDSYRLTGIAVAALLGGCLVAVNLTGSTHQTYVALGATATLTQAQATTAMNTFLQNDLFYNANLIA